MAKRDLPETFPVDPWVGAAGRRAGSGEQDPQRPGPDGAVHRGVDGDGLAVDPTGMVGVSASMTTSPVAGELGDRRGTAAAQQTDGLAGAGQLPGDHAEGALVEPGAAAQVPQPARSRRGCC